MKTYKLTEIFCSLQGEGIYAGTVAVSVRLAGCNLECSLRGPAGFDCDTDFSERLRLTLPDLLGRVARLLSGESPRVILTGGEPALQVGDELVDELHDLGAEVAIETNGTQPLPPGIDWVTCSPKRGAPLILARCDELKVVLAAGDDLPSELPIEATHRLVSPAFEVWDPEVLKPIEISGDPATVAAVRNLPPPTGILPRSNLTWCIEQVLAHPEWRLSVQQHKGWGIR